MELAVDGLSGEDVVVGDTDSDVGDADSAVSVGMGDTDSAVGVGVGLASAVGDVVAATVGDVVAATMGDVVAATMGDVVAAAVASAVGVGDVAASGLASGDDAGLVVAGLVVVEAPACTRPAEQTSTHATCNMSTSNVYYVLHSQQTADTHIKMTCKSKWQYSGCKCYASCWGKQILYVKQQMTHKCRQ